MYLAWHRIQGKNNYFIRESVPGKNGLEKRELVKLGSEPERFIVYPGGNSFYIHEDISDRLKEKGVDPNLQELETIFWPFVDPEIRHALRGFQDRGKAKKRKPKLSRAEEDFIRERLHQVDKRRLNYLRMGYMDQSKLTRIPEKFYRPLAYKSRDELEQWFIHKELQLHPREFSSYVYSFLNLRRHFYEIFAGKMPQGLNTESLDQAFLKDICELNQDKTFWGAEERTSFLHPYLVRYVIMFFDYSFAPSSFLQDILNNYIYQRQYRKYKQMKEKKESPSIYQEASQLFGLSEEKIISMSRRELIQTYRKTAQKLHPDKGGVHEEFIRLTEIYKILLKQKPVIF